MKIGITGARKGITSEQAEKFQYLFNLFHGYELHHGDCIGADSEAHDIAVSMGSDIVIYPPAAPDLRAFKKSKFMRKEEGYLKRDRNIVDNTQILIALPEFAYESFRSGTWYTVRYGVTQHKPVVIVTPTGDLVDGEAINNLLRDGKWGQRDSKDK